MNSELAMWLRESFPDLDGVPAAPNLELDGVPAVQVSVPGSPMASSAVEVYFIKGDCLFRIQMLDIERAPSTKLYDQMLATFRRGAWSAGKGGLSIGNANRHLG